MREAGPTESVAGARLKLHRVHVPPHQYGGHSPLFIAVGILGSYVAAICAFALLLVPFGFTSEDDPRPWFYWVLHGTAMLGPVGFVAVLAARQTRKMRDTPPGRFRRLRSVVEWSDAATRVPHRVIEYRIRRSRGSRAKALRLLREVQPNQVIMVNGPDVRPLLNLDSNRLPFEPIDVDAADPRLRWLVGLGDDPAAPEDDDDSRERLTDRIRGGISSAWTFLKAWWSLAFLAIMVINWLRGGRWLSLFALGALAAFPFLLSLIWERRSWIIPGGIVLREHRFGWRTSRVSVFGPESTPLLVDLGESSVSLCAGDRLLTLKGDDELVLFAILAAWASTARRPSREELLAFVGPDATPA